MEQVRLTQLFHNIFLNKDVLLSIVMLVILFIVVFVLFSHFTCNVLKKNVAEVREKYKIMYNGIQQIMAMSEDTIFGIDVSKGNIIYSDNMMPRFGWHFPDKMTKLDREDIARIWQVYEEDLDLVRKMFTDVCHDGKSVSENLRILNSNRNYVVYEVKLRPVLDRKNNVLYVAGNIKHD